MKKITLIFILMCTALLLGSCTVSRPRENQEETVPLIVVGFSQVGSESDWRNGNTKSMQEAFSVENGYRLILEDAQQKQEKQITAIRNFINQGVDYIVLAPTTEREWDTVLTEAKTAGIPVIIVDRMIEVKDDSLFTCWVGSDFRKEGDTAAEWMETHMPEALRIAHLQGNIGSSAQIGRSEGLNAALEKHPSWSLVFEAPGNFVQAKGQELVETLLDSGIAFDVLYCENDNMAYGALDALRERGLKPGKDVTIISFDATSQALRHVLAGDITLDVECNPMHGPRVQAIIEQLKRGETPPKYTYVDETYYDQSNISEEIISSRGY